MAAAEYVIQKPIFRKEQQPFRLTQSHIRSFLRKVKEEGKSDCSIRKYRTDLNHYYAFLNDDKWIYPDSLPRWRQSMVEAGYAGRSINSSVVTINSFYDFLGCWEWKLFEWAELTAPEGPELSREEYLHLLKTAKQQENIQLYLLVKILACTELIPSDLVSLTRESLEKGAVEVAKRGEVRQTELPEHLRKELCSFAVYRNIRSGPLFLNGSRKPINRAALSKMIADLGSAAGLESGKANPRNLRRMHLNTRASFQRQADAWVEERYASLLQEEEAAVGWQPWSLHMG